MAAHALDSTGKETPEIITLATLNRKASRLSPCWPEGMSYIVRVMQSPFSAFALALLFVGCAASDDSKTQGPQPTPTDEVVDVEAVAQPVPESPPATGLVPSLASVQLKQDCPDSASETAAMPAAKAEASAIASKPAPVAKQDRARKAKGKAGFAPMQQPCSQSTVQLSFAGEVKSATKVEVREVRLLAADGKVLATLQARLPKIWKSGAYEAWDGTLSEGSENKTSYKLSVPQWNDLESKLGGTSYGVMYTLEVDVDVGGTTATLSSPQFERGRPQIVKT